LSYDSLPFSSKQIISVPRQETRARFSHMKRSQENWNSKNPAFRPKRHDPSLRLALAGKLGSGAVVGCVCGSRAQQPPTTRLSGTECDFFFHAVSSVEDTRTEMKIGKFVYYLGRGEGFLIIFVCLYTRSLELLILWKFNKLRGEINACLWSEHPGTNTHFGKIYSLFPSYVSELFKFFSFLRGPVHCGGDAHHVWRRGERWVFFCCLKTYSPQRIKIGMMSADCFMCE